MRIALTLFVAMVAGMPAAAQEGGNALTSTGRAAVVAHDLNPADARRLDHYAGRITREILALAEAEQGGNRSAQQQHSEAIVALADRFEGAALAAGLSADAADAYFLQRFAELYSGRLPLSLAGEGGLPSIQRLLGGEVTGGSPAPGGENYVDAVRQQGSQEFDD